MHDRLKREDFTEIESNLPSEFSTIYTSIKTLLTRKIMALRSRNNYQNPSLGRQSTINDPQPSLLLSVQKSRLPIIKIPTVSGIYTE